jgi:hypothetical protein
LAAAAFAADNAIVTVTTAIARILMAVLPWSDALTARLAPAVDLPVRPVQVAIQIAALLLGEPVLVAFVMPALPATVAALSLALTGRLLGLPLSLCLRPRAEPLVAGVRERRRNQRASHDYQPQRSHHATSNVSTVPEYHQTAFIIDTPC